MVTMKCLKRISAALQWRVKSRLNRLKWWLRRLRLRVVRFLRRGLWWLRRLRLRVVRFLRRGLWWLRRLRLRVVRFLRSGLWWLRRLQIIDARERASGIHLSEMNASDMQLPRCQVADLDTAIGPDHFESLELLTNEAGRFTHHEEICQIEINKLCNALGYPQVPNIRTLRRYQRQLRTLVGKKRVLNERPKVDLIHNWENRLQLLKSPCLEIYSKLDLDNLYLRVAKAMLYPEYREKVNSIDMRDSPAHLWADILEEIPPNFHFEISIVLVTKRPEFLATAIRQINAQKNVKIELIIGCHGFKLNEANEKEIFEMCNESSSIVHLNFVEVSSNLTFGEAFNVVSQDVSFDFTTKWDDDDFYGSRHLIGLYVSMIFLGVDFVGRPANYVFLENLEMILQRSTAAEFSETRAIAGGTIFSRKTLVEAAGGWGTSANGIDQFLLKNAERRGFRVFSSDSRSFVLSRRTEGHTWNVPNLYFLRSGKQVMPACLLTEVTEMGLQREPSSIIDSDRSQSMSICIPMKDNQRALNCLLKRWKDKKFDEVVLVDDRSKPPLKVAQTECRIKLKRIDEGTGFGAGEARNVAALEGSGEILVFQDSDVIVENHVLEFVQRALRNSDVVHGEIGFIHRRRASCELSAEELMNVRWEQSWREVHWHQSQDLSKYTNTSFRATVGGFLAVRREIHEKIGGFRDIRIRGVEDTEYGFRLVQAGASQVVWRGSGIYHLGERTFSRKSLLHKVAGREELLRSFIPNFYTDGIFTRPGIAAEKRFLYIDAEAESHLRLDGISADEFSHDNYFDSFSNCPLALLSTFKDVNLRRHDLEKLSMLFYRPGPGLVVLIDEGEMVGAVISFGRLNAQLRAEGSEVVSSSANFQDRCIEMQRMIRQLVDNSRADLLWIEKNG